MYWLLMDVWETVKSFYLKKHSKSFTNEETHELPSTTTGVIITQYKQTEIIASYNTSYIQA